MTSLPSSFLRVLGSLLALVVAANVMSAVLGPADAATLQRASTSVAAAGSPGRDCVLLPSLCTDPTSTASPTASPTTTPTATPTPTPTPTPPGDPVAAYDDNPEFIHLPRSCRDARGFMKPELCRVLPRKKHAPLVIVWGDSHGWQMVPAVRAAIGDKRINLVMFMQGSCPPMLSPVTPSTRMNACTTFGNEVMDYIRKAMQRKQNIRLILGISWQLYRNATDLPTPIDIRFPGFVNDYINLNARFMQNRTPRLFSALGRLRVPTDVIGQMPMVYVGAPECPLGPFQCDLPRAGILKHTYKNRQEAVTLMKSLTSKPARLIQPSGALCDAQVCHGRYRGVPTYFDANHIGERASIKLAPYFRDSIRQLLRDAKARKRGRR